MEVIKVKKILLCVAFVLCICFPDVLGRVADAVPMWAALPVFGGVVCWQLWREGVI